MKVRHKQIAEFGIGEAVETKMVEHGDHEFYPWVNVEWPMYRQWVPMRSLVFIVPAPSRFTFSFPVENMVWEGQIPPVQPWENRERYMK